MAKKEGKKPKRKRRESKRYEKYKLEAGKIVRPRYCPRCGPGVILAKSSDRFFCGKCHYTEFFGKEEASQKQEVEKAGKQGESKVKTEKKTE